MHKKTVVVTALTGLALVDVLWAIESGRVSPLVASAAFAVVAVLVGARNEFRAGFIVGIAGVVVHVFELIFHGLLGVAAVEAVLFIANLCLSLVAAACSWSIMRGGITGGGGEHGGSAQAT
jgi:hypothetical protein